MKKTCSKAAPKEEKVDASSSSDLAGPQKRKPLLRGSGIHLAKEAREIGTAVVEQWQRTPLQMITDYCIEITIVDVELMRKILLYHYTIFIWTIFTGQKNKRPRPLYE